jgi:hypothetical protein
MEALELVVEDFSTALGAELDRRGFENQDFSITPTGNGRVEVTVGNVVVPSPEGDNWTLSSYSSRVTQERLDQIDAEIAAAEAGVSLTAATLFDPKQEHNATVAATAQEIAAAADASGVPRAVMHQMLAADKNYALDRNDLEFMINDTVERLAPSPRAGRASNYLGNITHVPPGLFRSESASDEYKNYAKFLQNAQKAFGDDERKVFAARVLGIDLVEEAVNRAGDQWMLSMPEEVQEYVQTAMGVDADGVNLPPEVVPFRLPGQGQPDMRLMP